MNKTKNKKIFFYDRKIDIKKYLRNNEIVINTIDELKKVKKLNWVFYNQSLMSQKLYKNYTKLLYKNRYKYN